MVIIAGIKAVGKREYEIEGKHITSDKVQVCILSDEDVEVNGFTAVPVKAMDRPEAIRVFGTDDFTSFVGCEVSLGYTINMKMQPVLSKITKLGEPQPIYIGCNPELEFPKKGGDK